MGIKTDNTAPEAWSLASETPAAGTPAAATGALAAYQAFRASGVPSGIERTREDGQIDQGRAAPAPVIEEAPAPAPRLGESPLSDPRLTIDALDDLLRRPERDWRAWELVEVLRELREDAEMDPGEKGKMARGARIKTFERVGVIRDRIADIDEAERESKGLTINLEAAQQAIRALRERLDRSERRAAEAEGRATGLAVALEAIGARLGGEGADE